jgi:CRISPR-associated endonuclease/helicase Cas3
LNILIASQCSKNALTETRRILDQFAERRGARTWQTPITFQGLKTLHKLLRQTARKNTAVACHWLRGKNHSELLWIVGDARRFNSCGTVPTNTTVRDILRSQDENDWRTAEEIRLLATLGGLFHDPGKANQAFQAKLSSRKPIADPYRHEWISLRLLQAFVGAQSDEAWLRQLAMELEGVDANWMEQLTRDGLEKRVWSPFKNLPPLATVVGWLLVSHHRIPSQPMNAPIHSAILRQLPISIEDLWCGPNFDASSKEIAACWSFPKGLPFRSKSWRYHVGRVAKKILSRPEMLSTVWLENPYVMHLARMALMLADHYYSSEPSHSRYGDPSFPLFANTDRQTGKTKQRLD